MLRLWSADLRILIICLFFVSGNNFGKQAFISTAWESHKLKWNCPILFLFALFVLLLKNETGVFGTALFCYYTLKYVLSTIFLFHIFIFLLYWYLSFFYRLKVLFLTICSWSLSQNPPRKEILILTDLYTTHSLSTDCGIAWHCRCSCWLKVGYTVDRLTARQPPGCSVAS